MSALTEYLETQPHSVLCSTFGQRGERLSRCSCWQRGVLDAVAQDQDAAVAVGVAILEGRGLDLTPRDVITAVTSTPPELGGL